MPRFPGPSDPAVRRCLNARGCAPGETAGTRGGVYLQHDPLNLAAAVADVTFDLAIGPEQIGIVLEFSLASDSSVEPLAVVRIAVSSVVIALASVGLEDAQAAFCQGVGTL